MILILTLIIKLTRSEIYLRWSMIFIVEVNPRINANYSGTLFPVLEDEYLTAEMIEVSPKVGVTGSIVCMQNMISAKASLSL